MKIVEDILQKERDKKTSLLKSADKLTNTAYHENKALSSSSIRRYIQNPCYLNQEIKNTPALTFGALFHKAILEKEDFKKNEYAYLSLLDRKHKELLLNFIQSIQKNKSIQKLTKDAKYIEEPIFWEETIADLKIPMKAKIDLFTKEGYLVDLKTSAELDFRRGYYPLLDIERNTLRKIVDKYRYDIELSIHKRALESRGEEVRGCVLVFFEKKPPYEIVMSYLTKEMLNRGEYGDDFWEGWKDTAVEIKTKPKSKRFNNFVEIF